MDAFAANAVRLQLHALAYNLGNFLRTLATPEPIKDWSLTSLKDELIKIGGEGGEPRPLCYLPDGRGRNPTADDPGDFETDRGTAAAAAVGTGMRRPILMHQRQPTGGARPNATQNSQTNPRRPCRERAIPEVALISGRDF